MSPQPTLGTDKSEFAAAVFSPNKQRLAALVHGATVGDNPICWLMIGGCCTRHIQNILGRIIQSSQPNYLKGGELQDAFSVGDMKKSGSLVLQYCYVWSPSRPDNPDQT